MNYVELVLLWAQSLREWLSTSGIELEFGESPDDRPKRSCWVNLRRGVLESELILWETGEAEFGCAGRDGDVIHEHYEFQSPSELVVVLGRLLTVVS